MFKYFCMISLIVGVSNAYAVDLHGTSGADLIKPWESSGNLGFSTSGADNIWGHAGNDILWGGDGSDKIYGGKDIDQLAGGLGFDELYGEKGDDWLYGNDGNDLLKGGRGDDHLYGGNGDDVLWGGDGFDYLYGGNGNDTLHGGDGSNVLVPNSLSTATDTINTGEGNNTVYLKGSVLVSSGTGDDTFIVQDGIKAQNLSVIISDGGGFNILRFEKIKARNVSENTASGITIFTNKVTGNEILRILNPYIPMKYEGQTLVQSESVFDIQYAD